MVQQLHYTIKLTQTPCVPVYEAAKLCGEQANILHAERNPSESEGTTCSCKRSPAHPAETECHAVCLTVGAADLSVVPSHVHVLHLYPNLF